MWWSTRKGPQVNKFNYKISKARIAKRWSQSQLAKSIGTTQQQIARYESGDNDVKSSTLIKLSKSLGVTISYLLGLDDNTGSEERSMEQILLENFNSCSPEWKNYVINCARLAASQSREGAECPFWDDGDEREEADA